MKNIRQLGFIITIFSLLAFIVGLEWGRNYLTSSWLSFDVGSIHLSAYHVLKKLVFIILLYLIASKVLHIGIIKIRVSPLPQRHKPLLIKAYQIVLYFIAFVTGMNILNIDLGSLAIFSGAVGIGLGFGLQKIASNFISGLILLFEKSVEEGDMVELENGVSGFIKSTGARYTLLATFDGKELMIPNEEFIIKTVTNWTFSSRKARVDINIGVSYNSDIERVMEILIESAKSHPACLDDPAPDCFLREYGDSSVNFVLFFWVGDVTLGRFGPKSDVLRTIWHKFKKEGIEIPFPQRDIHIIGRSD